MGLELDETLLNGPANHRFLEEPVGHARKEGEEIDADRHGKKKPSVNVEGVGVEATKLISSVNPSASRALRGQAGLLHPRVR